ncbi:MAG: hypothetical protein RL651_1349 [Pseudomonadota bacterium]|jgi:hypothetical protein
MNYFLLIASPSEDIDGLSISAIEMATRRLNSKSWGLWANTPHKKEIAPGDMLIVYVAGAKGKKFIATTTASEVNFSGKAYLGDGNALTYPPCVVLRLKNTNYFENPLEISGIKGKLDFIPQNVIRWGCVLQRGVKRISAKDARTILSCANVSA